ncbi:hypothetical protein GCM10022409_44660 [Hymenobacter glaciei]|uniref:DUF4168 domain-containing protein n=1 Tax=Hymenobacter glaciei TaxID=877209 RepID=A0ABP7UU44_9BACT
MNIKLPILALVLVMAAADHAQAQASLIANGVVAAFNLGRMASRRKAAAVDLPTANVEKYRGQSYPVLRTPTEQLPKKGAAEVTAVEAQLDRFRNALRADSTSALCTPEQRTAFQASIVSLARAQSHWDLQAYQQESAFYLAEDARRQRATVPSTAK